MKKLTAASLILILLFNLGGYRLWFYYAQQQSDIALENAFDAHEYNDAELITVKIPISLPYQTNWKEFERADGEINSDGKIYKYVKRRICNGELVLLCLPDTYKMKLEKAREDIFKNTNDLNQNNSRSDNAKAFAYKNISGEYDSSLFSFILNQFINTTSNFRSYNVEFLVSLPHTSPEQPPDVSAA